MSQQGLVIIFQALRSITVVDGMHSADTPEVRKSRSPRSLAPIPEEDEFSELEHDADIFLSQAKKRRAGVEKQRGYNNKPGKRMTPERLAELKVAMPRSACTFTCMP